MAVFIGGNLNKNDVAVQVFGYEVNSSMATTISIVNLERIFFHVANNFADKAIWVRLYPAAQDNIKRGIFLNGKEQGRTDWDMPSGAIYTGEISVVAEEDTHDIYVTEY